MSPPRAVRLRPPGRPAASSTVQCQPAFDISHAAASPRGPRPEWRLVRPRPIRAAAPAPRPGRRPVPAFRAHPSSGRPPPTRRPRRPNAATCVSWPCACPVSRPSILACLISPVAGRGPNVGRGRAVADEVKFELRGHTASPAARAFTSSLGPCGLPGPLRSPSRRRNVSCGSADHGSVPRRPVSAPIRRAFRARSSP